MCLSQTPAVPPTLPHSQLGSLLMRHRPFRTKTHIPAMKKNFGTLIYRMDCSNILLFSFKGYNYNNSCVQMNKNDSTLTINRINSKQIIIYLKYGDLTTTHTVYSINIPFVLLYNDKLCV